MKDSARHAKIVEEAIELYRMEGKPLPPATSGRDFANKMQQVARPEGTWRFEPRRGSKWRYCLPASLRLISCQVLAWPLYRVALIEVRSLL